MRAAVAAATALISAAVCLPAAAAPLPTYDQVGLKWRRAPNVVDMARHYPVRAKALGVGRGMAEVSCTAQAEGRLKCQVVKETEGNLGFGAAALTVMSRARVDAVDGGDPAGRTFGFRLKFGAWPASELPARFQPGEGLTWSRFPIMTNWNMQGQDKHETFSAKFDCVARASGRLTCTPTDATPDAPKFVKAAADALARARVQRADGASPEGARFSWTVAVQRQTWCSPGREDIFQDDDTTGPPGRCFPGQVQVR
ncbi:MAG TPA: hypothetical protein VEA44_04940 [Caulobacter sp.]|nr:hypothetical protein [Caulobacter sp.]